VQKCPEVQEESIFADSGGKKSKVMKGGRGMGVGWGGGCWCLKGLSSRILNECKTSVAMHLK